MVIFLIKKIFLSSFLVLLCLLFFVILCWQIKNTVDAFSLLRLLLSLAGNPLPFEKYSPAIKEAVYLFTSVSLFGISIAFTILLFKNYIWFSTKYTYEEYKAKLDEKKALKQAHKKEKLKQKLNELEKGE